MTVQNHLVIFARLPRLGTGKRRLATDVGTVKALKFQKLMLSQLLRRVGRDSRWQTYVAMTPDHTAFYPPAEVTMLPQPNGDLGHRMATVAQNLPPGPVIIIGNDIPDIQSRDIAEGFRKLGSHDAVFGPAGDGGFWAVGLKRRPVFYNPYKNVRWSTANALPDTLQNLSKHRVGYLRTLFDVDTGEDYFRYKTMRKAYDGSFKTA